MDPLSITASVIAVLGASGKTLEGLERLWELKHRNQHLQELIYSASSSVIHNRALTLTVT